MSITKYLMLQIEMDIYNFLMEPQQRICILQRASVLMVGQKGAVTVRAASGYTIGKTSDQLEESIEFSTNETEKSILHKRYKYRKKYIKGSRL